MVTGSLAGVILLVLSGSAGCQTEVQAGDYVWQPVKGPTAGKVKAALNMGSELNCTVLH